MPKLLFKIPLENINKLLPDSIDKSSVKSLEELATSSCLSETRKRHYKLSLDGSPDLHLSYGERLVDTYERTKAFHGQLPELTCKPVFISEGKEFDLLGQEFLRGNPLMKACFWAGHPNMMLLRFLANSA